MKLVLAAILSFMQFSAFAEVCLSTIDETAPEEQFNVATGGTVIDSTTKLMWMRCAIGQTWHVQDNYCYGDPTPMTWQQALQIAHGYEFSDRSGWRLPNLKELSTIVERQCVRSSINSTMFPNTPSDDFWTSTPSMVDLERSWVIAFFNGSNSLKQKTLFTYVRLVRNAD
ncbi:DUF1566 domain-containing protein [Alteromonadaceae bacterium BrNp21-10]|nr:DUF1566 domain-containing protein [Alteromonadaceae bacterium BrNp21-10]